MQKTGITIIGSGSSGNSILFHTEKTGILLDAGFSRKELLSRLDSLDISPEIIKALIISHEHSDHIKGARVTADQLDIPTYVSSATGSYLDDIGKIGKRRIIFSPQSAFDVEEFNIMPFPLPHDAIEPVGFIVSTGDFKIGIATDLGHLSQICKDRMRGCNVLILESNHDIEMQMNSDRYLGLKRRILGRYGHLSNEDLVDSLEELLTENCRSIFLLHISNDCNDSKLVEKLALSKLEELKRSDILLYVIKQNEPCQTVWY